MVAGLYPAVQANHDVREAFRCARARWGNLNLFEFGGAEMSIVGHVESLWRYPVKSMRGEELQEAFVGFPGVYGDRVYAFHSAASHKGFPYLTGREQEQMLLYRPRFRHAERMTKPPNLAEAEGLGPGITPLYAQTDDLALDVEAPDGTVFAIDDPKLIQALQAGIRDIHRPTLIRSERALTDCRPVSLFSVQTAHQLGSELGVKMEKRRFRANIYVDMASREPYSENQFVGKQLKIGQKTVIAAVDRDPRCKMITLDPDTAAANPDVIKHVAKKHDGKVGVYAAVIVEGVIRYGDELQLLSCRFTPAPFAGSCPQPLLTVSGRQQK